MANLVHRDYSAEFVKVGDTITVRKPATFVAKNFTGQTEAQDIAEGSVPVKMDRFRDITVNVGSKEMTLNIKDFSELKKGDDITFIRQQAGEKYYYVPELG